MNDRERRLRALETGRGSRPPSYEVVWEESHIEAEIDATDDRPGAGPVVVLTDQLWRRRYSADPNIV